MRTCLCTFTAGAALLFATTAVAANLSIPVSTANNDKEFWRIFMREVYGPYDANRKCWVGQQGKDRFCMRPNSLNRITAGGRTLLYATAAGQVIADEPQDCLNCTGNLGLFVLAPESGTYAIAAQSGLYVEDGVNGAAPTGDNLQVVQVSADGTHGWLSKIEGSSGAIHFENANVYAPLGNTVQNLGNMPLFYNDMDSDCFIEDTGNADDCSDYTATLTFDTTQPGPFAPVQLHFTGNYKNKPLAKTFTATFDATTQKYVFPQDMPGRD
jgi:hypothetical protein